MIKRLLWVFAFVLSTLAAFAYDFMVGDLCYNYNSDGTSVTVTYQNEGSPSYFSLKGALKIPESVSYGGISYPVTKIGEKAFRSCTSLTSVTIPISVTKIGKNAFNECRGITSVSLPNSVTVIDAYAFYSCTVLIASTFLILSPQSVMGHSQNAVV